MNHQRAVFKANEAVLTFWRYLLMFAWRMTRRVNLVGPFAGLPLVALGSFAVQRSMNIP